MTRPKRRILKWAGLVGCFSFTMVWILSLIWGFRYCQDSNSNVPSPEVPALLLSTDYNLIYRTTWSLHAGVFSYDYYNASTSSYICVEEWIVVHYSQWNIPPWSQMWPIRWPRLSVSGGNTAVVLPIWCVLLPLAAFTTFLWRVDRRRPPGHCQACGYDLTGNQSGKCPECGESSSPIRRSRI